MIPKTIIIVPAYNEFNRLDTNKFQSFCDKNKNIHFLFVDDASKDDTVLKIRELINQDAASFSVLSLPRNLGKGEAVRNGMLESFKSQPIYVGFWDADLSTPLDEIPRFLEILNTQADIFLVTGARVRLLGRDIERRNLKHYLGRISATLISMLLGIPCYDTQCGAKIFRLTQVIRCIFSDPFTSKWIFDVEILSRFLKHARTDSAYHPQQCVYELPLLTWTDTIDSNVKAKDYLLSLYYLLKIRNTLKKGC